MTHILFLRPSGRPERHLLQSCPNLFRHMPERRFRSIAASLLCRHRKSCWHKAERLWCRGSAGLFASCLHPYRRCIGRLRQNLWPFQCYYMRPLRHFVQRSLWCGHEGPAGIGEEAGRRWLKRLFSFLHLAATAIT